VCKNIAPKTPVAIVKIGAAIKGITAIPPIEFIIPVISTESISAFVSYKMIISCSPFNLIISTFTLNFVSTVTSTDDVIALIASNNVIPSAAVNNIVSGSALYIGIIKISATDRHGLPLACSRYRRGILLPKNWTED